MAEKREQLRSRRQFNFYEQHDANRRKTHELNVLLIVSLLVVLAIIYLVVPLFNINDDSESYGRLLVNSFHTSAPWWFLIAGAVWYTIIRMITSAVLNHPVDTVMSASNADEVTESMKQSDPEVKMFDNVVTELALAYGINKPRTFIVNNTTEPNAFATGSPRNSGVAITRPLLDMLNRNEVSGVMGHELAHVVSQDSKTSLTFAYYVAGLSFLVMIGWVLLRNAWIFGDDGDSRDSSGAAVGMVMALIGLAVVVAGFVGKLCGTILQFAMSRTREYDADAQSAKVNMTPDGLISSLTKIDNWVGEYYNKLKKNALPSRYHALYFVSNKTHLFDDHPSTKDRIQRLREI